MRPSRPAIASLVGIGLGVAGCDTQPSAMVAGSDSGPSIAGLPHDIVLAVVAVSVVTLALLVASVVRQALIQHRFTRLLRIGAGTATVAGRSVHVVPGSRVALVAGIRRPATFLSADVMESLTNDELHAVLAHERHHELRRAPARLIVLLGIGAILGRVRPVTHSLEVWRARIEIDADTYAIRAGSTRRTLAQAILKLGPSTPTSIGFGSADDLRLRALLGEPIPTGSTWVTDVGLAGAFAVVTILLCQALLSLS